MITLYPRPDAADFTTKIDNPFLSYRPGTTFISEKKSEGEVISVTVTDETRVVDGVTCVVVHDIVTQNGFVIEDTYDWYAQDKDGNVWYFGEETYELDPLDPHVKIPEGAWEAGVDGAQAGIVMLADPAVGDRYYNEYYVGEAEDWAEILSLEVQAHVPYGSFDEVLKTRDVNPLDPSEERKFHVAGVGTVLEVDDEGDRAHLVRIEVEGTGQGEKIKGYAGGDWILGRGGDDRLKGLAGNDTLAGNWGDDTLQGGEGYDVLKGGRGDDLLKGGEDGDTFVFWGFRNGRVETDTVADYDAGDLDALHIRGGAKAVKSETETETGWRLKMKGDGDVILLEGVEDENGDGHILDELLLVA